MPIKSSSPRSSLQQRQIVRRILNARGYGVIRSVNSLHTRQQILKKLQQREINAITPAIPVIDTQKVMANERLLSGQGTYSDFQQTDLYKNLLKENGEEIGTYIARVTFFEYALSNPSITFKQRKDLELQRASALSTLKQKIRRAELRSMSREERSIRSQQSSALKQQVSELNRMGFSVDIPSSLNKRVLITDFSKQVKREFGRQAGYSSVFGYTNTPLFDTKLYSNVTGYSSKGGPKALSFNNLFSVDTRKKK